jgi:hypothetical protein
MWADRGAGFSEKLGILSILAYEIPDDVFAVYLLADLQLEFSRKFHKLSPKGVRDGYRSGSRLDQ